MKKTTTITTRRLLMMTVAMGTFLTLGGLGLQFIRQKHQTEEATVQEAPAPTPETSAIEPTPETRAMPEPEAVACDNQAVQEQITQFLSLQAGNTIEYAIGYYNLETGCEFYANAQQEWLGASTTKVILALMAYEQIAVGALQPEQLIDYEASSDYEAGAGGLQYQENLQAVDVQTLIEVMILESDNIAKNMLLRVLGGREGMHEYLWQLTGTTVSDPTTNQVTAQQLTQVMKHLMKSTTPGSAEIQTLMAQTSDQTRIAASSNPDGSQPVVVHKIGDYNDEGYMYLHDCAIVYTQTPYILVVMTKSQPESDAFVYEQITTLTNQLNALHQ